jgi:sulfane dehydrogenase subunit SoxC
MTHPGRPFSTYGAPSAREPLARLVPSLPGRPGTGSSRTPLERLEGVVTPNGLHFERHHNGVPDIDPERHRLAIHGLVRRPLAFSRAALDRYPKVSQLRFIECAGNSGGLTAKDAPQASAGALHGLLSCAEWTGVPLSTLLDECGVQPGAAWVIAEGADASGLSRSVPLSKCLDDAIIALYQNGEPLRPEQGYPMRLLLPGYEGNISIKWLRRLKVVAEPGYTKDETSRYTELMPDGKARIFTLPIGVKSVILRPSFGLTLSGPGLYEISGLAWSGAGRIRKVEVSADGGRSWAPAALDGPVLSKSLTRFRSPWMWNGAPAVLMSRATDEGGERQPTREAWVAQYAPGQPYHYNAINSWGVDAAGQVRTLYA